MKHTSTPNNMLFEDIPAGDGIITIDDQTQHILMSFLMEYRIEPKNWRQIVTVWYRDYPYVSLKEIDKMALMEFTIQFKLFLLRQLSEIIDMEQKAFAEVYGRHRIEKQNTLIVEKSTL
jgi:hypothetical protein